MDDVLEVYRELLVTQLRLRRQDGRIGPDVLAGEQSILQEMQRDNAMNGKGISEMISAGNVHEGRVRDARTVLCADATL